MRTFEENGPSNAGAVRSTHEEDLSFQILPPDAPLCPRYDFGWAIYSATGSKCHFDTNCFSAVCAPINDILGEIKVQSVTFCFVYNITVLGTDSWVFNTMGYV